MRGLTQWLILPLLLIAGGTSAASNPQPIRLEEPETVLRAFLTALANNKLREAYDLVDPETKKHGEPIANRTPVDYQTFVTEAGQSLGKFSDYRMGDRRTERNGVVRIWVSFGGDNDETMLVRRNGRWYVADPIHIIR
jgi:hypothetical protein